jgi:hypothetical protein
VKNEYKNLLDNVPFGLFIITGTKVVLLLRAIRCCSVCDIQGFHCEAFILNGILNVFFFCLYIKMQLSVPIAARILLTCVVSLINKLA